MKRILALALALLLVFGATGCKSSNQTSSDNVSYITTYEDEYIDVYDEDGNPVSSTTQSGTSNQSGGGKENSGTSSSGGNAGTPSTKPVNKTGTISNLDFGGKTFTKTIIGTAPAYKIRMKEAFEKKFNCKIKFVNLPFQTYNSKVASAMAAGDPYDICGLHPYFWPEAGVQGLYEPLDEYFYKDDLYDPNSKSTVGIDLAQSQYYSWNGKTYGVANNRETYCSQPDVYYYNKVMFEDAGLEDPMELYNKGKWTWDKLFEMAEDVVDTKKGKYMFGYDFSLASFVGRNGIFSTKTVNGKVKTNLDDPAYPASVKKAVEFFNKYCAKAGGRSNYDNFINGNHYMHQQEITWGTFQGYDMIINAPAFDKDFSNLGIVPLPKGPDNKNDIYSKAGPQAKAAGKGSKDPRVAVAYVWFASQWKDPMQQDDPSLYSDEVYKMLDKVYKNTTYSEPYYKTSTKMVSNLTDEIWNGVRDGQDWTKLVNDRIKTIQSIIDDSLGQ